MVPEVDLRERLFIQSELRQQLNGQVVPPTNNGAWIPKWRQRAHQFGQWSHLVLNTVFNPIKDEKYFDLFYRFLCKIHIEKDPRARYCVWAYAFWIFITWAQFVYFVAYPPETELEAMQRFDGFFYLSGKWLYDGLAVTSMSMQLYCSIIQLLEPNIPLLGQLNDILQSGEDRSFFALQYPIPDDSESIELAQKGQKGIQRIRKLYKIFVSGFSSILATTDGILIFMHYRMLCGIWHYYENATTTELTVRLTICQLFGLLWITHLVNYSHVTAIAFTSIFTLLSMAFLKFKQVTEVLHSLAKLVDQGQFSMSKFLCFRASFAHNMRWFFSIDACYGRIWCVYLFFFCPMNVIMSMWALEGKMPLFGDVMTLIWCTHFTVFLFVCHIVLAQCTVYIHRPSKKLLHVMTGLDWNGNSIPSRTRMHLHLLICALHLRKKKYGFNYGDFGLVSMSSFVKYLLLYGVFMMSSYEYLQANRSNLFNVKL